MFFKYNLLKTLDSLIDTVILFFLSPNFIFISFISFGMPNNIYSVFIVSIFVTIWYSVVCFLIFKTRKEFIFYRMWTEDLERIFIKISIFNSFESKSHAFSEFEFSRNLCKIENKKKSIEIDNYARIEIIRNLNRLIFAMYTSVFIFYVLLSWVFFIELNVSRYSFFAMLGIIFSHYIITLLFFLFCFIHAIPIFFMRLQNKIKNM